MAGPAKEARPVYSGFDDADDDAVSDIQRNGVHDGSCNRTYPRPSAPLRSHRNRRCNPLSSRRSSSLPRSSRARAPVPARCLQLPIRMLPSPSRIRGPVSEAVYLSRLLLLLLLTGMLGGVPVTDPDLLRAAVPAGLFHVLWFSAPCCSLAHAQSPPLMFRSNSVSVPQLSRNPSSSSSQLSSTDLAIE